MTGEAASGSQTEAGLSASIATSLIAYRAGDRDAMTALVRRVTPLLWHLVRSFRLDSSSAEDVVQNTLLAFVRHCDTIVEPQAALRWMVVTARREALRTLRQRDRVELIDDAARPVQAPTEEQPEEVMLASAAQHVLWRNVARLPERCQRLLRVIAFADRPDYGALSVALGMPVGSIGPTRGRCLAKLRTMLSTDPEWSSS
jgi:RNA polymerase sigma factor (sigma-70 family)